MPRAVATPSRFSWNGLWRSGVVLAVGFVVGLVLFGGSSMAPAADPVVAAGGGTMETYRGHSAVGTAQKAAPNVADAQLRGSSSSLGFDQAAGSASSAASSMSGSNVPHMAPPISASSAESSGLHTRTGECSAVPQPSIAARWSVPLSDSEETAPVLHIRCNTTGVLDPVQLRWCSQVSPGETVGAASPEELLPLSVAVWRSSPNQVSVVVSMQQDCTRTAPGTVSKEFRGRGEEFAVTPLTFVAEKCQYRGSLEFFTVGTVCVDAVLDFAKFLGVEEVARKTFPWPTQVFLFSDVVFSVLSVPPLPSPLPQCQVTSPGRWLRRDRSNEARRGWVAPTSDILLNATTRHLGCYFPFASPDDYVWEQIGCQFEPVAKDHALQALRGLRVLFVGDSQMRNTWVTMARVLGLSYPGDEEAHDGHVLALSDNGFCATNHSADFTMCWRTDYTCNACSSHLVQAARSFNVVFFNPASHWRSAGSNFDTFVQYRAYCKRFFKQLARKLLKNKGRVVMVAPYPQAMSGDKHAHKHKDHRTVPRLRIFNSIARTEWANAGFQSPWQYMPFPSAVGEAFYDCTFDPSHYDFQVAENVVRMLITVLHQRFPTPPSDKLVPISRYSLAEVTGDRNVRHVGS